MLQRYSRKRAGATLAREYLRSNPSIKNFNKFNFFISIQEILTFMIWRLAALSHFSNSEIIQSPDCN